MKQNERYGIRRVYENEGAMVVRSYLHVPEEALLECTTIARGVGTAVDRPQELGLPGLEIAFQWISRRHDEILEAV
jgi:hypothetical protein